MRLLIYTAHSTPRTRYIFSILLPAVGAQDFSSTENVDEYNSFTGIKINYSTNTLAERECRITPSSLLTEKGIQHQPIECNTWNGLKNFFLTGDGDLPFDIFAASFYLLTRYEEYLPHKLDMYGRYAHENSLAFKEGFLNLPLVNLWLMEFKKVLEQKFPDIKLTPSPFTFSPTYDIDIAWSYLHKGLKRNAGAALKNIVKGEMESTNQRLGVLMQNNPDPFDCYDWLDKLHHENNLTPIYFFLLAQKNKKYDKNILPSNEAFQQLVKQHSQKYQVGIHPSWQSGDEKKLLKAEIDILENISGRATTQSRQHYIRMTLPSTYRELAGTGITEDYSMGYGSINGFRASYCLPYFWYDLEMEAISSLKIFPFCFMDANSFYEQKYNQAQTAEELLRYYSVVKKVNGNLITIWHNQFLGTDKMFAGWKEVYEDFVNKIIVS